MSDLWCSTKGMNCRHKATGKESVLSQPTMNFLQVAALETLPLRNVARHRKRSRLST